MSQSTHLQLPYLASGQAQKHVTVNESLLRLDALVQLAVVSGETAAEPADPEEGALYILPAGKSGDAWDAMAEQALAYWRDGIWEEVAPRVGWRAYVCDEGVLRVFDGAAWTDVAPADVFRVLAASAVALAHTGNTSETTLATITVPANAMGANGVIRVTTLFSATNNANSKHMKAYWGPVGGGGQWIYNSTFSTQTYNRAEIVIQNRNATNAQISTAHGASSTFSLTTHQTHTRNTTTDQVVAFTGQLANAADTITLEGYLLEVLHRA